MKKRVFPSVFLARLAEKAPFPCMLSVAFVFFFFPLSAQKVQFPLGAAAQVTLSQQQMRFSEHTFYSIHLISPTVQERTFYQSRSRFQQSYRSKPGFSVRAYAAYELADRWHLRTGLGLSYQSLEWQEQYVGAD